MGGSWMPENPITQTATPGTAQAIGERLHKVAQGLIGQLPDTQTGQLYERAAQCLTQLPEPGSEAWKYSPVNRLYESLVSTASSAASQKAGTPEATEAAELLESVDLKRYPLAAVAALDLHHANRIVAKSGDSITLNSADAGNHWTHIEVPDNVHATLIQRQQPDSGTLQVTTVILGAGASLDHAMTGCANPGTRWHLLSVKQLANSNYSLQQLSLGGALERIDTHVRLMGTGANATLTGALLCGDRDRCDNQTVLEHAAPRCTSTARYHGLANHLGKLTFGGRIHILEDGAGTDARLHNPNLLLSDDAEINTKPELEIYNDDVACAHGATVGQLDEAAVFYLRSRGITRSRANALLLRGFVREAVGGPDADYAQELTEQRLAAWTL